MLVKQRPYMIIVLQLILIVSSATLAWLLRFDFALPNRGVLLSALPVLVLMRFLALARFNLFHGYWRYTGISDALDITKAVALGSVGFVIVERFVIGEKLFPLSIYLLELVLTGSAPVAQERCYCVSCRVAVTPLWECSMTIPLRSA